MSELLSIDYEPFWLSLKLSFITTFILFFFCVALAYFMSQKKFFGKAFFRVYHLTAFSAATKRSWLLSAYFSLALLSLW